MRTINSSTILSKRNVFNVYHGCSNRCVYCPSRSRLAGVKNFANVGVKENAPLLLDMELRKKRKKCMLFTGTLGDPYQPIEERLHVFEKSLRVVEDRRFGINILTKSALISRDIELLNRINDRAKVIVQVSLSTLNDNKRRVLEPGASKVNDRIGLIQTLTGNNIPVLIRLSPILPFINDHPDEFSELVENIISLKPTGSARRCNFKNA